MKMELNVNGVILVIETEGALSLQMREARPQAQAADSVLSLPVNEELFTKLVELRKELATSANVPPYVVFNDKTLREMASCMPSDLVEMGSINGVGQAKLEKYGEQFLAAIKGAAA